MWGPGKESKTNTVWRKDSGLNRRFFEGRKRNHFDGRLGGFLELDGAVTESKKRKIATEPHVFSGVELGSALTDNNASGGDELARIGFHAEHLRLTVATVTAAGLTFLMCHFFISIC